MSQPSKWPLNSDAIRTIPPHFILEELAENPISKDCYPLAMGYYPRAKRHFMDRQQHDDNLLIYCTDGMGHVKTGQFQGLVKQGDILLLPAGQAHHYHANSTDPWTIYWFHFDGSSSTRIIRDLSYDAERPVTTLGLQPQLIADFKRLLSVRHTGYRSAVYRHAASVIRQMLCYLAMEIRDVHASQNHNFSLEAIERFMLERLDSNLDLSTLAASFNLSKYHFSAKYKQLTGDPPIKHFIHMKMERACYLLDSSQASVKTISSQLGYDDALYFSRLFRKVTGLSPTMYRNQTRG